MSDRLVDTHVVDIEIRRVATDEVQALRATRLAALADAPSAFGSTLQGESTLTDRQWSTRVRLAASGPDRATFLAWRGSTPVGIVGGYRGIEDDDENADEIHLVSMWVDPTVRRSRLGRRLVETVVGWADELQATAVTLWVTAGNDAAIGLYSACGFVPTGDRQPLPSDPTQDELRMHLGISERPR